ncbi:hypothetical protein GY45DRAFT_1355577 [Cubamyces sp. BRFM 1775]|nr:hypothetical protein GY45DRAFT_1355577 [Cubamyces sp. BRFM 1775]
MSLAWHRGCVALIGPRIDAVARAAISHFPNTTFAQSAPLLRDPDSAFHLTVFTKDELRDDTAKAVLPPHFQLESVDTRHLHFIGIGGSPNPNAGVFFIVVVWAAGQILRGRAGLGVKQFHITLSVRDDHTLDKGIDAVLPENRLPDFDSDNPDFLDHLALTLHMEGRYSRARRAAIALCRISLPISPDSDRAAYRGFLRLGDAALKDPDGLHKLTMLAYACAYTRCSDSDSQSKLREYCLKRIEECAQHTEWGCVFTEAEWQTQLPAELAHALLKPWPAALRDELSRRTRSPPTLCISPREPFQRSPLFVRLPRFFRWLVPFHVALMSSPRDAADIDALASPHLGIRHMDLVMRLLFPENDKDDDHDGTRDAPDPVLIHCGGGKGRAGTVAACYLVACGFTRPNAAQVRSATEPMMSAHDAIVALRTLRPGSIETQVQEEFVARYASAIWKRRAVLPELVPEPPPCPLEIEVDGTDATTVLRDADLLLLVGLPGSGKSTFCRMLTARSPRQWTYISQDESRSRSACETALGHARRGTRVLVDLCNVARAGREAWLALAAHWAAAPVCVWFDYPATLCESRAQNRAGHPTLPPGGQVRRAMEQMKGAFVRPELGEGFKAVVVVRSFAAAEELVGRLSPPVGLFKFPRTPHLLDLGSATDDDIVVSNRGGGGAMRITHDSRVVLTEKVDGANLGFSLSSDRTQILVQNRSHYVNPSSHEQFGKLGVWLERHRVALTQVLGRDPLFAQRYILFGEWLVATHSIAYDRLPDWFLAFDLYDRSTGRWADRRTLEALLAGTDLQLVPVVSALEGRMPGEDELRDAVKGGSRFYDGPVEGVYVKVERGGEVVERGKVVRAGFIAGNEHWTKGPLRKNGLQDHSPVS